MRASVRVRFGDFVLDADERVLLKAGVEQSLEPKVFECLALLVGRAGKLTSMAQLRSHLWPDVSVADGALRRIINEARKVLGDTGAEQSQIRTRKGVGYVFVAQASVDASVPTPVQACVPRDWPFVGRALELERLCAWLSNPSAGGTCLLSGEAGAGKTSLLARLRASQRHARWLSSLCPVNLGVPTYWPFRQIALQLMQIPELRAQVSPLTRAGRHVLCALPELGHFHAGGGEGVYQFELCEAFGALPAQLSQQMPLCLVIEDLHWADAGSIAMLDAVARAARSHPLQVLTTYRPEAVVAGAALSQFIGRTSEREGVWGQHLPALELEDIRALLRRLQLPGWDGAAPGVLLRMTGGNALFLSELLRHALALQLPLDAALPPSMAHIVEQRVRVLPEATRALLGQAAVLGHDFSLAVLAVLTERADVDTLLADLEPARRAGVLRRDVEHADRWLFSHALLGDALVESLPLSTRSAYHCRAMYAWQSVHGPAAPSGVLAAHAFAAAERLPSRERRSLCERAGREAFAAHAFDQAILQLGRAIQLLEPEDGLDLAAELSLLWARAHWHADAAEQLIEQAFLQAAECARRAQRPELLAQAAIGYALGDESSVHLRSVALRPEALELLEEAWTRYSNQFTAQLIVGYLGEEEVVLANGGREPLTHILVFTGVADLAHHAGVKKQLHWRGGFGSPSRCIGSMSSTLHSGSSETASVSQRDSIARIRAARSATSSTGGGVGAAGRSDAMGREYRQCPTYAIHRGAVDPSTVAAELRRIRGIGPVSRSQQRSEGLIAGARLKSRYVGCARIRMRLSGARKRTADLAAVHPIPSQPSASQVRPSSSLPNSSGVTG